MERSLTELRHVSQGKTPVDLAPTADIRKTLTLPRFEKYDAQGRKEWLPAVGGVSWHMGGDSSWLY